MSWSNEEFVFLEDVASVGVGLKESAMMSWVTEGTATFFVGAGVSARGSSADATSVDASHQLKARVDDLKRHFDEKSAESAFMEAFAQAYVSKPDYATDYVPAPLSAKLEKLAQSLVSLVTVLTRRFDQARHDPKAGYRRYYFTDKPFEIPLEDQSDWDKPVFAALDHVLDVARGVSDDPAGDHASTEWGRRLVEKLRGEICSWIQLYVPRAVCLARWAVDFEKFQGVRTLLNQIYGEDRVGLSKVTSEDLKWLSDLLWLIVRIDLPFYPTSHELSIELGVSDESLFPPTPILSKSAEAIGKYDDVVGYIEDRFRIKNPPKTIETRFSSYDVSQTDAHHVLAAALAHMTPKQPVPRKGEPTRDDTHGRGIAPSSTPGSPVLLTTNFDLGIEEALERILRATHLPAGSPTSYRVVFPVLVKRKVSEFSDQGYEIRWIVKERTPFSNKDSYTVVCPAGPKTSDGSYDHSGDFWYGIGSINLVHDNYDLTDALRGDAGPIIVKLHGSPLESLGELERDKNLDVKHYVIASEYHYVSALTRKTYALPFLNNLFSPPGRHLIFMGYSLGDWNVRVALAQRVYTAQQAARRDTRKQGQQRLAVVKERILSDVALFNRLKVSTIPTAIRTLVVNLAGLSSIRPYLLPETRDHIRRARDARVPTRPSSVAGAEE